MKKLLSKIGVALLLILFVLASVLFLRFGGGNRYTDITDEPELRKADVLEFFSYEEPLGNIAATNGDGPQRIFFTVHPESRPKGTKLLEIVNGEAVPYPTEAAQANFDAVLGVFCDRQNRLWTIDHGQHGTKQVKLLAFDLATNSLVHEYVFPREIAEKGSFFNDLSLTPDGKYVFIADVSFFAKQPSLIVYNIAEKQAVSLLNGHPSVRSQGYVPVTPQKKMRFIGGLVDLMPGIDGIDISADGDYVYYAAMTNESLYRVPVEVCTNFNMDKEEMDSVVSSRVELVCKKPLNDGIRCDAAGNIYITDVEHQGFSVLRPDGNLVTLIKDNRIRWADGASIAGDGYLYFTDSGIPDIMLRSRKHITESGPYKVFRFSIGTARGNLAPVKPAPVGDSLVLVDTSHQMLQLH